MMNYIGGKTMVELYNADSLDQLRELYLRGYQVDSVVTDPPYHLASILSRFKGTTLDADTKTSREASKTSFGRLAKGFMGNDWDNDIAFKPEIWKCCFDVMKPGAWLIAFGGSRTYHRIACAIEDAGFEIRDQLMWLYGTGFPKSHDLGDGQGTALKPAHEPICLARKPITEKTNIKNKAKYGTAGLNIDECRIPFELIGNGNLADNPQLRKSIKRGGTRDIFPKGETKNVAVNQDGRFPANIIHDGLPEVLEYLGEAARFFYSTKTSKKEKGADNTHPTVKPVALMEYLCKLITPKKGIILDPFLGSGSTGIAAKNLGYDFIGIEKKMEYFKIAQNRINITIDDFIK